MTQTLARIEGNGLLTNLPVQVDVEQAPTGSGITFHIGETVIPASPEYVINTERGVTLGKDGKVLSIVEHFLSACAMSNHTDLTVRLNGAPELPLLDGSSIEWLNFLNTHFGVKSAPAQTDLVVKAPVEYQLNGHQDLLLALPCEHLEITYLVSFPHPDLDRRWLTWNAQSGSLVEAIAPARTFGMASELPALQARGMAMGVTVENTLGLTDEGGYTSQLRMPDEPIRHKILDLIGDLLLCGIPIQRLQGRIIVNSAGHGSHIAFGKLLRAHLGI